MNNYIIYTDSACDLTKEFLDDLGVKSLGLTLKFDGEDKEYRQDEIDPKVFYASMREGKVAKTSAVNSEAFKMAFEETVKEGLDILYIGFSSGLSTTFNSARIAAEELKEDYPDRKIMVVDSLSASAGFGLLLKLAVDEMKKGKPMEEVAEFVEDLKLRLCHWFTVDDLVYLKRGGRISPTVAFVGGLLGIKPVLHCDNEGKLVSVTKVRGRAAALKALADKVGELKTDLTQGPIYICHGDCEDDVNTLDSILKEKFGLSIDLRVYTGPVIGAHSGPGTVAIFFVGKER